MAAGSEGAHALYPLLWLCPPQEQSQRGPCAVMHFGPHSVSVMVTLMALKTEAAPQWQRVEPKCPCQEISTAATRSDSVHRATWPCEHLVMKYSGAAVAVVMGRTLAPGV